MTNLTRLTAVLASVVPALGAAISVDGPADLPKIKSITYSGSGCIKDPAYSGNLNDPTFTYSNFAASFPGTSQTLNCEVHITLTGGTPGWQFALSNNWVKGHVVLPPGACLDYYTQVFFSQNAAKTSTSKASYSNNGGSTVDQTVTLRNNLSGNKVWSGCTGDPGILNVNFRGALSSDTKAYFEAVTENWDIEWRRC
ncbi:hypothetical protein QBC37DRAFT_482335 [Rhypophila decipiens]|uniref:Secreted protein n=1 Tax=Rhypophila decipiens TaxID=261697 RepID=A0AAN7B696_9PEZI|nr:hypothetical protein QBC37DRAFT_482335 [Rhypophila decipiens]